MSLLNLSKKQPGESVMQFIDLAAQQQRIREKVENRIRAVLDHHKYIMGPEIPALESELASYTGSRYAISCASGTDALLLAFLAYGIGPGDAVITTPFTFIATAEAVALLGAVPVFVDIDPVTFNIDPGQIEAAMEALSRDDPRIYPIPRGHGARRMRVRGIIGVDLFGLPADYDKIGRIADKHGIFVIEDAAQSFGGEYFGRKACSLAEVGCTSFFPAKPLGCYGDGGMCFTDDESFASKLRSLRVHGQGSDRYDNVRVGINGRLDTMQAAILLAKFEIFPEELQLRQEKAKTYTRLLTDNGAPVRCPEIPEGYLSAWAQYSVLAKDGVERSNMQEKLKQAGIPTAIYYPRPLHLQPAFSDLGYREGDFPVSEDCAKRIFSLPMHPYLDTGDQEKTADTLRHC
jgi:dTDP-4-amino-4,6-dideoxygalactose transaminase